MRTSTNRDPSLKSLNVRGTHRKANAFSASAFHRIVLVAICLLGLCAVIQGCAAGRKDGDSYVSSQHVTGVSDALACQASEFVYPTTAQDFSDAHLLYGHRGFLDVYQNVKHLGRDIAYAEGTAIHPIACGTIRFYGSASGYGTLAAVVEHELASPIAVLNGEGEPVTITRFLSIYGHLRKSSQSDGTGHLSWKVGDAVQPSDTIGYIQDDAQNGDGPEHLHLGIRLQGMVQAKMVDPSAWFRGNDTAGAGNFKKYYTDPATFMAEQSEVKAEQPDGGTTNQPSKATNFPIGTLLRNLTDGRYWLVVGNGAVMNADGYQHLRRDCAVDVSSDALACSQTVMFDAMSLVLDARVVKFSGEAAVYRLTPAGGFIPSDYRPFISYDAFLSWGYDPADVEEYSAAEKAYVLSGLSEREPVGFMPGALVKGNGQSEVAVADQFGLRRPLFNWDVFVALGYDPTCIMEIEASTLDICAGLRSDDLVTLADTVECRSGTKDAVCISGTTVPCGCAGNVPGTQSCLNDGMGYADCICQGGGGSVEVTCQGIAVNDSMATACCGDGSMGMRICLPDGTFSDCLECRTADSGAALGCVPGTQETCHCSESLVGTHSCNADGSAYDACSCTVETGSGGASGSGGAGTGGYSGTVGSSGNGGAAGIGPNIVTIKYTGRKYVNDLIVTASQLNGAVTDLTAFDDLPKDITAWFDGNSMPNGKIDQDNDGISDCKVGPQRDVTCTFTVPKGSSLLFQVSLGAYRFWGDASGNNPAPCIAENVASAMSGTSSIVLGQVELFVNGDPFVYDLITNNYTDPNWQANGQKCGASHTPYYNGFAVLP